MKREGGVGGGGAEGGRAHFLCPERHNLPGMKCSYRKALAFTEAKFFLYMCKGDRNNKFNSPENFYQFILKFHSGKGSTILALALLLPH